MDYQRRLNRQASVQRTAMGLGWFSIGLGLTELFFARPLARSLGMAGDEGLLRLYGLREIATGLGIFAARKKAPWIWGRVAGDGLDIATLASNVSANPKKAQIALALANVVGVTVVDAVTAQKLSALEQSPREPVRDYSDRVGFSSHPDTMRGAALKDFDSPRDMRVPEAMRPRLH